MADTDMSNGGATDSSLKRKNSNADEMEVEDGVDLKKVKQEEGVESKTLKFLAYKDLPYEEQLKKKVDEVEQCFKTFHGSFPKQYPELGDWYRNQLLKWFRIEEIRPSPKQEGYRNKCELTIGFNPEIGKLGAGVRTSHLETERVEISTTDESYIHLPKPMIELSQEFSKFLEPWNDESAGKCPYLYLYIRANSKEELMVMVIVQSETDESEEFAGYKDCVVKFCTEDCAESVRPLIKSIYLQARPAGSTKKSFELPFSHAWGEHHLTEELLDTTMLVTPSLFFNINTYAAEIVYKNVVELADCRKKKTLVIDLFCGCGVLSMIMAKKARHVIAIDPSKWNIKQAKTMAAHNNIKNIQFVIGKPDEALSTAWSNILQAEEVVLIIDPPSNSKPRFYIDIIGDMNNLSKVIYLNSNSKSNVVKNLMSLTEAALLPARVVPVDIAPHTVRLEMVVVCKKFDAYQISRPLGPCEDESFPGPPAGWGQGAWGSGGGGGGGGYGSFGSPDLEEIERRAFAMGLAKGAGFGGSGGGGGGQFYDDFPNGPARVGFGYGGGPPPRFGGGFGRSGPPPRGGRGGFRGGKRGRF
uniref:tRNA (uracil(54)-C(5))-methyltransferase n=3 Tax=Cacopsylla melanoneura TaxID=428564 RepID=A0A8D8Y3T0_9HEMI